MDMSLCSTVLVSNWPSIYCIVYRSVKSIWLHPASSQSAKTLQWCAAAAADAVTQGQLPAGVTSRRHVTDDVTDPAATPSLSPLRLCGVFDEIFNIGLCGRWVITASTRRPSAVVDGEAAAAASAAAANPPASLSVRRLEQFNRLPAQPAKAHSHRLSCTPWWAELPFCFRRRLMVCGHIISLISWCSREELRRFNSS